METMTTNEDIGAGNWTLFAHFCAMPVEREYLNGKALAQYLGVSEMTLHRWRFGYAAKKQGVVSKSVPPVAGFPQPAIGFGNPLWSRTEIDEFLRSRKAA